MRVNPIVALVVIAVWLYVLSVTHRAKLHAWEFIIGSLGLFTILMMTVQPVLTMPLARCVSALAGVVGSITGAFTAYFKYGIIFVHTGMSSTKNCAYMSFSALLWYGCVLCCAYIYRKNILLCTECTSVLLCVHKTADY